MDHSLILPSIIFAKVYSVPLIVLSIAISIVASFSAFGISERALSTQNKTIETLWNIFGAIAMGSGVWAMHFVGMLALSLPVPIAYDVNLTILSVIPAVTACGAIFWIINHDHKSCSLTRLLIGGLIFGVGIGLMHYIGMAAMQLNATMIHSPQLFSLSLIIAIILATAALKMHHSAAEKTIYQFLHRKKLLSAIVMGFAMAGMHYTAMLSANFSPLETNKIIAGMPTSSLSIAVSIVTFSILLAAILIPLIFRYKETVHELEVLNEKFKKQQQSLSYLVHYDELTKLPNRTLLADRFSGAISHAKRSHTLLAICFLDLDKFKPVNDKYGHDVGDELLIEVAHRIKLVIRSEDTVSRQGGDEFILLLSDLESTTHCEQVLTRLLRSIAKPYFINGHQLKISASMGATLYPTDNADLDLLVRHADHAMYQAKSAGRNNFKIFKTSNPQSRQG